MAARASSGSDALATALKRLEAKACGSASRQQAMVAMHSLLPSSGLRCGREIDALGASARLAASAPHLRCAFENGFRKGACLGPAGTV